MTTVATDRRLGINSGAVIKTPSKVKSAVNLALTGEQTIAGVACVTGDRVFVAAQTTSADNGIWTVDTGNWTRTPDFDGAYDVVSGTRIPVYRGAGTFAEYLVSNTGTITIGTTGLTFEAINQAGTFTSLVATAGAIFSGKTAAGVGRQDAQLELQNFTVGSHALLSLYQDDPTDESGICISSKDTAGVVQIYGQFGRFVNNDNTHATWKGLWGVHVVGAGVDNTQAIFFSGNSGKLLAGPTAGSPWNTAPGDNTLHIGSGTTTLAGLQIALGMVAGWAALGPENLTLSSANYSMLVKNDASAINFNVATGGSMAWCINNQTILSMNTLGISLGFGGGGGRYIEMFEETAPAAGAADTGRLFLVDSGAGKTILKIIFATGAAQTIATQP